MPYVPSKKTDGKSTDREVLDVVIEELAIYIANRIQRNYDLLAVYKVSFMAIAIGCLSDRDVAEPEAKFAKTILEVGSKYYYEGAFLGELNYSITRVIQRVPQILAKQGKCELKVGKELRYWLYAMTIDALTYVQFKLFQEEGKETFGIAGVFEDIKDEYKRRVNPPYESEQILKSGDCYDTPYFTKIVKVINDEGKIIGYADLHCINDGENYKLDILPYDLKVVSNKVEHRVEHKEEGKIIE